MNIFAKNAVMYNITEPVFTVYPQSSHTFLPAPGLDHTLGCFVGVLYKPLFLPRGGDNSFFFFFFFFVSWHDNVPDTLQSNISGNLSLAKLLSPSDRCL